MAKRKTFTHQSIEEFFHASREEGDKNPIAVWLGQRGGLKGGPARAASMTAEERSQAARLAAKARWSAHNKTEARIIKSVTPKRRKP